MSKPNISYNSNECYFSENKFNLTDVYVDGKSLINYINNLKNEDRYPTLIQILDELKVIEPNADFWAIDLFEGFNYLIDEDSCFYLLHKIYKEGIYNIGFGGGASTKINWEGARFLKCFSWLGVGIIRNLEIKERKFEKHFLYLNRIKKRDRFDFFVKCYESGILHNSYWSWAADNINDPLHKTIENVPIDDEYSHLEVEIIPEFSKTFLNIIPETFIDYEKSNHGTFFPTEKTEKSIVAGQPFIIASTPGFLRGMKELGFKTFDTWWDESYDNEPDFSKRMDMVVKVLCDIKNWPLEKCEQIYGEMIPILKHNQEINIELSKKRKKGFFVEESFQDFEYLK